VTTSDPMLAPPVPVPDVVSRGYWDSTEGGVFAIARCTACRMWDHPPQERCRICGGDVAFEAVSGRGIVFSFIVNRRQFVPGHPPGEVIALVELDEQTGLRLTALLDAAPNDVSVGAAVVAHLVPVGDSGFVAPVFELA